MYHSDIAISLHDVKTTRKLHGFVKFDWIIKQSIFSWLVQLYITYIFRLIGIY